jgi:lysozyme family protein
MAASGFDACLAVVLASEGGYADDPRDPGGATNRGITRATLAHWRGRPVSKTELRTLGRAEAVRIYRALYWDAVRGDDLPPGIDLAVFDHAVNAGPGRAVRTLQAALGQARDAIVGPATLAATRAAAPAPLIRDLCRRRLALLARLAAWRSFGRGWHARIARTEAAALAMAARSDGAASTPFNPGDR